MICSINSAKLFEVCYLWSEKVKEFFSSAGIYQQLFVDSEKQNGEQFQLRYMQMQVHIDPFTREV